jgi:hypothetical protein
MRRLALGILVIAAALGLGGCARSYAESEVRADGSWKRSVKLVLAEGMGEKKKIGDVFALPKGAQTSAGENEETAVWTTEHAAGAEPVTDLTILHQAKPVMDNEVTVREISPGRWEYREVIRWKGPRDEMTLDKAVDRANLPPLLRERATSN